MRRPQLGCVTAREAAVAGVLFCLRLCAKS
jgi:hypothetical protein